MTGGGRFAPPTAGWGCAAAVFAFAHVNLTLFSLLCALIAADGGGAVGCLVCAAIAAGLTLAVWLGRYDARDGGAGDEPGHRLPSLAAAVVAAAFLLLAAGNLSAAVSVIWRR